MQTLKLKPAQVFFSLITILALSACSGSRPSDIGITNNKLLPCPDSPNCVNSFSNNQLHAIKPLRFKKPISQAEALMTVKEAVLNLPRTEIITETKTYLYAEATSKVMRFVDDIEFMFPNEEMIKEVHVRSASRLGYKDFDVNRLRIESIRANLIEKGLMVRE